MNKIRAFISYSSQEKNIAGTFKHYLQCYCGFDVFLAHEDIRPSSEWEDEITDAIVNTDFFIPLISQHFKLSEYTNQEVGMALILKKIIIPIKLIHINPYGFMKKYHAFQFKVSKDHLGNAKTNLGQLAAQIALLGQHCTKNINQKTNYSVAHALLESSSFDMANTIIGLICRLKQINKVHIDIIIKAMIENNQVKGAFGLKELKNFLLNNYRIQLD